MKKKDTKNVTPTVNLQNYYGGSFIFQVSEKTCIITHFHQKPFDLHPTAQNRSATIHL